MLWLGGLSALDLTTSTPDALCPPLEEARAAIESRVGEVRGEYQAEFALIRGDDGHRALKLVLRERKTEVLSRELPLDDAGCDDAAQAMALVLESYFDAIEKREPDQSVNGPEIVRGPRAESASQVAPLHNDELAPARGTLPMKHAWQARAGFVYDIELGPAISLGAVFSPPMFRLSPRLRIGVALDAAQFLTREAETVREAEIAATTLRTALSVPMIFDISRWSWSMGPWAELRLQRAVAPALPHGRSAYRALPGVGAFGELAWAWSPSVGLGAGAALGAQLPGVSAKYFLQQDGGGRNEVLVPHAWFGEAQLTLAFFF
jgi:hypothetical protein